ncbi:hypothetical protein EQG49_06740 [Periweissella cryptocerci]|uniref:Uncharacterized protein n=1 Tax=Periweissella cryptocerci TaxID=2506420 RepID=A0A4P6YTU0_9LACO|nr:hypothetical protein [Periweissella cryptocerci]QBO36178.1 hypothetical protein EQG49_06740 [Periweissella cryptocerci]
MAKTQQTKNLEKWLWQNKATKHSTWGVYEVTFGDRDLRKKDGFRERVDFMTAENSAKGMVFRTYELKISLEDFRTKAAKSFVGDYGYFVMPYAVWQVIPVAELQPYYDQGIGVITPDAPDGKVGVIKAKHLKAANREAQGLPLYSTQDLMETMMKSAVREQNKLYKLKGRGYWE